MIVVDSSVVVEWLLGMPHAEVVGDRIMSADSLHAPALIDVEVAQVVRRHTANGAIDARTGERLIKNLQALDVARYTHELLLPVIWRLRHNLTAYDAAFVALAELLNAPLITLDARLARAPLPRFDGAGSSIELIG